VTTPESTYSPCDLCGRMECECDDADDCPDCGKARCVCFDDDPDRDGDPWHNDYLWGGDHITWSTVTYWSPRYSRGRWRRAWALAADGASLGTVKAIGRTLSPVGAPLDGYPKQRRANARRKMQQARTCRSNLVPW